MAVKIKENYTYPPSRLLMIRGKWHVIVSIPAHLRFLYNDTQRDKRKSTRTSDHAAASRLQHGLAQQIYDEFDARQNQHMLSQDEMADGFAADTIKGLAVAFKHKAIPDLEPSTNYDELESFKSACDHYASMVLNAADPKIASELIPEMLTGQISLTELVSKVKQIEGGSRYSLQEKGLAGRYRHVMVQTFWHDLLIEAARMQGLPEPRMDIDGKNFPVAVMDGVVQPDMPIMRSLADQPIVPISRPARVVPAGSLTICSVMDEYLADMRLKQRVLDTQKKLERWNKQFVAVMGDLELSEIKPKHGYEYIRKVLEKNPNRSNRTIKDYCWGVQNLLKYCVECGYIQANPFRELSLNKYGEAGKETYPYTAEELKSIFSYDWDQNDRLLLSILATTGMRPSEAGNMTWERINDTEHVGIRYFTTRDVEGEEVRIKNESSKRDVPLHPDLVLPEPSTGRLFDYTKDEDGRCSTNINARINPVLKKLVSHPSKSIRSFRRTFKVMLRDVGVSEEVHDAITGHNQTTSSGRKNYGGMGIKVKFDAVSRLDISFLKAGS